MGPEDLSASMASGGRRSGVFDRSNRPPERVGGATTRTVSPIRILAPICSRKEIISLSPWGRSPIGAEICMSPPTMTAADRRRAMLEKSAGTVKSDAAYSCLGTRYFLYGRTASTLTPNFFIVAIVASRYGLETKSPSISSVIPFSVLGAAIRSAETNWLETDPDMDALPPGILPSMVMGGLPPVEVHVAPRLVSASRRGCMGRFLRLASPVSVILASASEAMAAAILIVVPEFEASISAEVGFTPPVPSTVSVGPSIEIFAPKDLHAPMVARVSRDNRTFLIVLFPFASEDKKTARCV